MWAGAGFFTTTTWMHENTNHNMTEKQNVVLVIEDEPAIRKGQLQALVGAAVGQPGDEGRVRQVQADDDPVLRRDVAQREVTALAHEHGPELDLAAGELAALGDPG